MCFYMTPFQYCGPCSPLVYGKKEIQSFSDKKFSNLEMNQFIMGHAWLNKLFSVGISLFEFLDCKFSYG